MFVIEIKEYVLRFKKKAVIDTMSDLAVLLRSCILLN